VIDVIRDRTLRATAPPKAWDAHPVVLLTRRPLLLAFVLGCGVSALTAGRFTPRLVLDGALSLLFVPLCEMLGFAVVYRTGRRPLPFAMAADAFFAGNDSWFWWFWAIMAVSLVLPPTGHHVLLPLMLLTAVLPVLISAVFDFRFWRGALLRSTRRAALDVFLLRAIAWPAAFACFFGVAIPARDVRQLFVEMWQTAAFWVGAP
jgi:hypothetical protein